MSRKNKTIIYILLIIILSLNYILSMELKLDYKKVIKKSEENLHYGPSEVKLSRDIKRGKLVLSEYDSTNSINIVDRKFLIFYKWGYGELGLSLSSKVPISYRWTEIPRNDKFYYNKDIIVYGKINNENIRKIKLVLSNGDISEDITIKNGFFVGIIPYEKLTEKIYFQNLLAFDENNKEIFKGTDINN